MKNTIVIDTNLLLDDANVLFKLSTEYEKIVVPLTVLKELDKHKYNPNLSYSARNAIHAILNFKNNNPGRLEFYVGAEEIDTADMHIINGAIESDADIATKDISMSIVAESKEVDVKLYDVVMNNLFDPYVYINTETLFNCNSEDVFCYQQNYELLEYEELFDTFERASKRELNKDAWFFVIIESGYNPIVYAHHPIDKNFDRIDNNPIYRQIIIDEDHRLKARDVYQVCAIYALREAPHAIITGRWGSGKTLLATAYSLYCSKKKTFITRAPVGINNKYDLGFLPGSKDDKMMDWLAGFTSALYFIYGNTRGQKYEDFDYDYIKDVIFRDKFEILPMNSIQGLSLLDNDILIADEVQLITVDYMSMILSRPSGTGKLILLGDLGQTYNVVKPSESGLLKLLRALPNKHLALVNLKNSYRSGLLEVADKLQDRTLG